VLEAASQTATPPQGDQECSVHQTFQMSGQCHARIADPTLYKADQQAQQEEKHAVPD